ncbi:DUF4326 domain-containing protein [Streptomyces rubiginosohelvolus]
MTTPTRIQRRRTKGWTTPLDAQGRRPVYVGRGSKWGNPWRVGDRSPWAPYQPMTPAQAVEVFRYGIDTPQGRETARRALAGRDLMCWCPLPAEGEPDHCHAAVLLDLANTPAA